MNLLITRARRYKQWREYVLLSRRKVKINRLFRYIGRGYEVLPHMLR